MDFTLQWFEKILSSFLKQRYVFQRFDDYLLSPGNRVVIMRHDVDRNPNQALVMARMEQKLGIQATYFFRTIRTCFKPEIIKAISEMGHEIGYHYEDLATAKGDYQQAIKQFKQNLNRLRRYYPVKTICMHGSPVYNWDNRDIWKKYNYRDFDVIGEPYFDLDFTRMFYLTDASRKWNDREVNFRDHIPGIRFPQFPDSAAICQAIEANELPSHLMMNIHPHNWGNSSMEASLIFVVQSTKNLVKSLLKRIRTSA